MAATGRSPYALSPREVEQDENLAAELLDGDRWWDVWDNISFRSLVTVYPPMAQVYFLLANRIAPGSILVLKLGIVTGDLLICLLLLRILKSHRLPLAGLVLYAWNPLVIKEFSGSGHLEPLMILPMLAAIDWLLRKRHVLGVTALASAALVKLAPLAVAPVAIRRLRGTHAALGLALLTLGFLPFLGSLAGWWQTLQIYSRHWQFNSGVWALVKAPLDLAGLEAAATVATWLCRTAVVTVALWSWRGDDGTDAAAFRGAFFLLAALVIFSPTVMPWYLSWALPFAIVAGFPAWSALCALSLLSYSLYVDEVELVWPRVVEYGGFLLAWYAQHRHAVVARAAN